MVLSAPAVLAAADVTMTLTSDKQTLMPGDQVTIILEIDSEKDYQSLGMIMLYDEKIFQVVEGECDPAGMQAIASFDADKGFVAMYWSAGKNPGKVGQVTLQVLENAPAGSTTFTGRTSVKNGDTSLECAINTLTFQIGKEQVQKPEQSVQSTESEPSQTEQTTQTTEFTQIQKETVPAASEPIITIGQTAPVVEKGNDTLLIAVIAVAVVAAMAVGGYLVLKKKK